MGALDIIWKMIRYNLKIVFGNKFIYFLLGAVAFFLFITTINIFDDNNPRAETVYYVLLMPGFLLMFYPDLTSLDQVDALPIHEFNLRVECIRERLGIADVSLEESTQPITKRSLIEVLMEKQRQHKEGVS